MKSVAVIHTVPSVIEAFAQRLHAEIPDLVIYNLLDEFLSIDPNRLHRFEEKHVDRLKVLIQLALSSQPDLIVSTCSTLSGVLAGIRDEYPVPIITIDEAMIKAVVAAKEEILILATAESSVPPLLERIKKEIASTGEDIQVSVRIVPDAFAALQKGNKAEHDRLIVEYAAGLAHTGTIVLSQVSMGHVRSDISRVSGCRVFSAIEPCVQQIAKRLGEQRG